MNEEYIDEPLTEVEASNTENEEIEEEVKEETEEEYFSESDFFDVEATAYDLSEEDCNKTEDDPYFGITANGFNLSGLSHDEAMVIAVDRNIIPLGSKVEVIFYDEELSYLNGIYSAEDTGGAIKGCRIDVFMGVDQSSECRKFGRRIAKVRVI